MQDAQDEDRRDAGRYRALREYTKEATRDEWTRFLWRSVDFDTEADRVKAKIEADREGELYEGPWPNET